MPPRWGSSVTQLGPPRSLPGSAGSEPLPRLPLGPCSVDTCPVQRQARSLPRCHSVLPVPQLSRQTGVLPPASDQLRHLASNSPSCRTTAQPCSAPPQPALEARSGCGKVAVGQGNAPDPVCTSVRRPSGQHAVSKQENLRREPSADFPPSNLVSRGRAMVAMVGDCPTRRRLPGSGSESGGQLHLGQVWPHLRDRL